MFVSPSFRPSLLGIELTEIMFRRIVRNMLTMIRDGYKVNLQPYSEDIAEDEASTRGFILRGPMFICHCEIFKNFANFRKILGIIAPPCSNFAGLVCDREK